jgi:hypothetical protein
MGSKIKYSDIKEHLNQMFISGKTFSEVEEKLHNMISENPQDELKYKKAFFTLTKDTYTKQAILYGEDVIKEENDPKFMQVLAVRYQRIGDLKKYNTLIKHKIPMAEFRSKLQIFVKEKPPFFMIETHIKNFLNENPHLKIPAKKMVFSVLKDVYTEDVVVYGKKVLEEEKDPKFIKVLAVRYKRIGEIDMYNKLMSIC